MMSDADTQQAGQRKLLDQLDKSYNLDEARELCFTLGLDYDNLGGEGKRDRLRELIAALARHGRLPELIATLRDERPQLTWPDPPAGAAAGKSTGAPASPRFVVPFHENRHFTGRAALLAALQARLGGDERIVALVGLGGVGKTQLALAYSYAQRDAYDLVYWLRADDSTTLGAEVGVCAQALGLAGPDADVETARALWLAWLERTERRWLLVFDNADAVEPRELRPYLPKTGNGRVLITSRNPNWGTLAHVLRTDVFTAAEAVAFLARRTGQDDGAAAAALAEAVGRLPLALEHAAAYAEETGCTLADYHALFREQQDALWTEAQAPDAYHATVTTTWEIAFRQVRAANPAAVALLNLCCFLAPDDIPLPLLAQGADAGELPEELAQTLRDPLALNRAVAGLRRYSLLRREGDALFVHRLVQAVARQRLGPERAQEWAKVAVDLTAQLFGAVEANALHSWEAGPRLLPHATAAADLALAHEVRTARLAYLCNALGFYLNFRGDYAAAQPYYEEALAILREVLGERHPSTATSLNNLGALLDDMGDTAGARPYYEEALAIRREVLGARHPDTAMSLNNLGALLDSMGDTAGARPYLEEALAIFAETLGPRHPHTATSLNNLGYLLRAMGDHAGARPYLEEALAITREVLGPRHPSTAASLNNLGELLQAMGDTAGARPYFEEALAIRREVLGARHPDTAGSLNNLGELLQAMGDYAGARPYYEEALAIRREVLGPRHPLAAGSLNNLGTLLQTVGDYAGARPYYEEALAIRREVLGDRHPDTAQSLNNLGYLLQAMGDTAGARPYYEEALAIRREVQGPRHPDTATILNNLGYLLQEMGDTAGARPYYEEALAIRREVLGPRHPDTAGSLNNLGYLLQAMGDYAGARPYFEEALAIHREVLGERHPSTATSLNNLGYLLQAMGDYAGARPYVEEALAIRREVLGERHPDTAASLWWLGVISQQEGKLEDARPYFKEALAICEETLGPEHPTTQIVRDNLASLDAAEGQ